MAKGIPALVLGGAGLVAARFLRLGKEAISRHHGDLPIGTEGAACAH